MDEVNSSGSFGGAVKLHHLMTLNELKKNYTSIPWTEFFRNSLPSSMTLEDNDIVDVVFTKYIEALEKLLSWIPKRDQANYVMWNAIVDCIPFLNHKLRARQGGYLKAMNRQAEYPSRWKKCIDTIATPLGSEEKCARFSNKHQQRIQTDDKTDVPGGILQGVFFSSDRPNYMNYGAIGSVVGQELAHVLDDQRARSHKKSNWVDRSEPPSKKLYLKCKSCKGNRHGNYKDARIPAELNGINIARDEKIADNGGIGAAYRAYENWVASNGPERMLPGINRTPQQMFWISFANVGCSKERPEALKDRITTGIPSEYRILRTLSQIPEFSRDFSCPVGSKMNPKSKCPVL